MLPRSEWINKKNYKRRGEAKKTNLLKEIKIEK